MGMTDINLYKAVYKITRNSRTGLSILALTNVFFIKFEIPFFLCLIVVVSGVAINPKIADYHS